MLGRKEQAPLRFGEVAVAQGFVRPVHIKKALGIQSYRRARGQPVPMLGELLLELGWLTAEQADAVFEALLERSRRGPVRSWWARIRGR